MIFGIPSAAPIFHWLFPTLDRPVYTRASFLTLTLDHVLLVAGASIPVVIVGVLIGIFVTRPFGREFGGVVEGFARLRLVARRDRGQDLVSILKRLKHDRKKS